MLRLELLLILLEQEVYLLALAPLLGLEELNLFGS